MEDPATVPGQPPERRWRAHPLVRLQRWLWPVLVTPLAAAAVLVVVYAGFGAEVGGLLAVALIFVVAAAVQWRAGGTEVRLEADRVVIRGVRPQRIIPLDDIVRVDTEQRLAHQVVLETTDRRIALPRVVTSEGFLGPDDRSEEIRAAIAAAVEFNR